MLIFPGGREARCSYLFPWLPLHNAAFETTQVLHDLGHLCARPLIQIPNLQRLRGGSCLSRPPAARCRQ